MILIAAYKTPAYGRFAYNLAHSIKDKLDIPICLLTDGKTGIDTSIFDIVKHIETPDDPCVFKLNLRDYSPFEKTLYLDADMICMNDISPLIEYLKPFEFWVDTLRDNESFWLKPESFSTLEYQDCNTSIMYWVKGEFSESYFDDLDYFYMLKNPAEFKHMWGKFYPDEAFHSLALSANKIKFDHTHPIHYCDHVKKKQDIVKQYFMSMYGARIATYDSKELYDTFMDGIMKRAGKSHEYKIDQLYRQKFIAL